MLMGGKMENYKTSEILEKGLKKFLIFGIMFIIFFIFSIFFYNLHTLILNLIL